MKDDKEFIAQIDADFMQVRTEDEAYIRANISRLEEMIKECPEDDFVDRMSLENMLEQFREQLRKYLRI